MNMKIEIFNREPEAINNKQKYLELNLDIHWISSIAEWKWSIKKSVNLKIDQKKLTNLRIKRKTLEKKLMEPWGLALKYKL